MSTFVAGKRSLEKMESLHKDLVLLIQESFKVSQVDFTVIECGRTTERQQMLFDTGKSKVNPKKYSPEVLITKGKHIINEHRKLSDAFDFIVYVKGKGKLAYDRSHLMYLIGVFTSVGNRLFQDGKISKKIRSGANWDMDGELIYDQRFLDAPHIERV